MAKKRTIVILLAIAILLAAGLVIDQYVVLRKAHSTFEDYYAFRGCTELLERTDTEGVCRTDTGQTITIVLYRGRWYLKGDLPGCFLGACL